MSFCGTTLEAPESWRTFVGCFFYSLTTPYRTIHYAYRYRKLDYLYYIRTPKLNR